MLLIEGTFTPSNLHHMSLGQWVSLKIENVLNKIRRKNTIKYINLRHQNQFLEQEFKFCFDGENYFRKSFLDGKTSLNLPFYLF